MNIQEPKIKNYLETNHLLSHCFSLNCLTMAHMSIYQEPVQTFLRISSHLKAYSDNAHDKHTLKKNPNTHMLMTSFTWSSKLTDCDTMYVFILSLLSFLCCTDALKISLTNKSCIVRVVAQRNVNQDGGRTSESESAQTLIRQAKC